MKSFEMNDKPILGREGRREGSKFFMLDGREVRLFLIPSHCKGPSYIYIYMCVCVCVYKSLKYNLLPCKGLLEIQEYYPTHNFLCKLASIGRDFLLVVLYSPIPDGPD
jgi:hypothetical protein